MNVLFTENAWEDYLYWQRMDKKIVKRINELIIEANPITNKKSQRKELT